jgi:predicted transglutaminase-like cysteine proteinase
MLSRLQAVLDRAHAGHVYTSDISQYQVSEHWTVGLVGDCEDMALWCREQLAGQGIASSLVYCKTESGGGHLVCAVEGWILDNRHKWVMRRDDLPYTWLKLGDPDGRWYELT